METVLLAKDYLLLIFGYVVERGTNIYVVYLCRGAPKTK